MWTFSLKLGGGGCSTDPLRTGHTLPTENAKFEQECTKFVQIAKSVSKINSFSVHANRFSDYKID